MLYIVDDQTLKVPPLAQMAKRTKLNRFLIEPKGTVNINQKSGKLAHLVLLCDKFAGKYQIFNQVI
jgi:hypothetical protein